MRLWVLAAAACGGPRHHAGIVRAQGDGVALQTSVGETVPLVLRGEATWLAAMAGFTVEVEGERVRKRFVVETFDVTAGPDGSAPYFGVLNVRGTTFSLQDRTTGAAVALRGADLEALRSYDGRPILIIGPVVGPQTVFVVTWRPLDGS